MASDTISFTCPACGIKLTVAESLAGVSGPCPSCRTQIQAPYPAVGCGDEDGPFAPAVQPAPTFSTYPPAPMPTPAAPIPLPQQPYPGYGTSPPLEESADPAYAQLPVQTAVEVPVQARMASPELLSQAFSTSAVLRPESRLLPSRSACGEPVAKQIPDPSGTDSANPLLRAPHPRGIFRRCLLAAIFVLLSAAFVFGVLTALKSQGRDPLGAGGKQESGVLPILPEDTRIQPKTEPGIHPLPALEPAQPTIVEPPPELPEGIEPKSPGLAALEVLEKFLAAKTLAERLPMMETQTPEAELAVSVLAGPLPETRSVLIDAQEVNAIEQVLDIYYNVDFETDGPQPDPQTLLVRIRGASEPRVAVDSFLDLFGGRLATYAANPTEKSGTFQVIISAVASCNNQDVPDREKKLTLKLLARDNTKEIAEAYFGRQSKIGLMLEDGTYSLGYGRAKACTVMLRWNLDDNPEKPYLEALDLKTLDWNP